MGDEVEVPLDALVRLPREIVPELVSMPAVAVLHVLAAAANLRSGEHYEQLEDGTVLLRAAAHRKLRALRVAEVRAATDSKLHEWGAAERAADLVQRATARWWRRRAAQRAAAEAVRLAERLPQLCAAGR